MLSDALHSIIQNNIKLMYKLFFSSFLVGLSCLNVSSQVNNYGITVITHGYQVGGSAPNNPNDWPLEVAQAIIQRAGGNGCIRLYNKATGLFGTSQGCTNGEIVLIFNWAEESRIWEKGFSEAAGDALFAALMDPRNKLTLNNLHFIGHSRGTVVNTEVVLRLLHLGKSVDHVTNIDPHDWGASGLANDFDNHPELPGSNLDFNITHPGVVAWESVNFYDTYYQSNGAEWNTNSQDCGTCIGGLEGREVAGTANYKWNYNGGYVICHTTIHECAYLRTINNIENNLRGGYEYARLGGQNRSNAQVQGARTSTNRSFSFFERRVVPTENINRSQGIVNGSFDRGSGQDIPGWKEHGGGGNGVIGNRNGKTALLLAGSQNKRTHNRFYIPPGTKTIRFGMDVFQPSTRAFLTIKLNGQEIFRDTLTDEQASGFEQRETNDISAFVGQTVTMAVEVTPGVPATVYLTDFELSNEEKQEYTTLFLFDMSGSMNESGNSGAPKIQEAKSAAITTLQQIGGQQQGITQQVGLTAFSGDCVEKPLWTNQLSFTTNFQQIAQIVTQLPQPFGGTPLPDAIKQVDTEFRAYLGSSGKGRLIILSDGQSTCGAIRPEDVYAFGQRGQVSRSYGSSASGASASNIQVRYYTIGFNIAPGSPAERDLQYLAQVSGGKYLNAQSQEELARAFKKFNRFYIPKRYPSVSPLSITHQTTFSSVVASVDAEDYLTAFDEARKYATAQPNDCNGAYNLALMGEANERYKLAYTHYEKYLMLCPASSDAAALRTRIEELKQEYAHFLAYNKQVIASDMNYLDLYFKKIQNGESVALALEFIGFIKEKWNYYQYLPDILEIDDRVFKSNAREVFLALDDCVEKIRESPQKWDREATPVISRMFFALNRLLEEY